MTSIQSILVIAIQWLRGFLMMRMLYRLGCCRHGDGTLNTRLTCIHPITFFVYNGYSLCEAILANAVVVRSYILLFYLTRICYLILLDFCLNRCFVFITNMKCCCRLQALATHSSWLPADELIFGVDWPFHFHIGFDQS